VWFAVAVTAAACGSNQQSEGVSRSAAAPSAPKSCAELAALALPHTTIASVDTVAAGAFRSPGPPGIQPAD
jgi:hypothetical protein